MLCFSIRSSPTFLGVAFVQFFVVSDGVGNGVQRAFEFTYNFLLTLAVRPLRPVNHVSAPVSKTAYLTYGYLHVHSVLLNLPDKVKLGCFLAAFSTRHSRRQRWVLTALGRHACMACGQMTLYVIILTKHAADDRVHAQKRRRHVSVGEKSEVLLRLTDRILRAISVSLPENRPISEMM